MPNRSAGKSTNGNGIAGIHCLPTIPRSIPIPRGGTGYRFRPPSSAGYTPRESGATRWTGASGSVQLGANEAKMWPHATCARPRGASACLESPLPSVPTPVGRMTENERRLRALEADRRDREENDLVSMDDVLNGRHG